MSPGQATILLKGPAVFVFVDELLHFDDPLAVQVAGVFLGALHETLFLSSSTVIRKSPMYDTDARVM